MVLYLKLFEVRRLRNTAIPSFEFAECLDVNQCCQTLSPFATCGDNRFKCGDRQLFKNGFLVTNSLHISQIMTKFATEKLLSPQLWQMWRQKECGCTPLMLTEYFSRSLTFSAQRLLVCMNGFHRDEYLRVQNFFKENRQQRKCHRLLKQGFTTDRSANH